MKRLIGIILSLIIVISCTAPIRVEAKIIEPDIVKTESWTTSYYIDDDMDTLYPYIQCEADIYNDGTIKLYMWNTHEWDGFATVEHEITVIGTAPVSDVSMLYSFKKNGCHEDTPENSNYTQRRWCYPIAEKTFFSNSLTIDSKDVDCLDVGFYPESYNFSGCGFSDFNFRSKQLYYEYVYPDDDDDSFSKSSFSYDLYYSKKSLPTLEAFGQRPRKYGPCESFSPTSKTNLSDSQYFHLFGHDITITPELLSGNIIAEPELTDQEKYIKQLEEENARLKASIINTNYFGDINKDNLVDVADAQMILNYYVYTLVDSNAEPLEEWISKQ